MFGPPASSSNWQNPIKELGVVDPGLAFQYGKPPGCGFLGVRFLFANVPDFGVDDPLDQTGVRNPGLKWYDLCHSRTYFERLVIFLQLSSRAFPGRDLTLDSFKLKSQRLGQT